MHGLGRYRGPRPCATLGENSKYDTILALKKFRPVAVVLGSENQMKAIKCLCCHEVRGSLEAHPDSSGADDCCQEPDHQVGEL